MDTTTTQTSAAPAAPGRPRRRTRGALIATAVAVGGIAVGVGTPRANAVVDGEPATAADNPWQVALVDDVEQFCGGSLVSDRVVVTAAHCVVGMPPSAITVRAGVTDLDGTAGQTRAVTTIIEHPKYVTGTGDIAMLVLDRPVEPSSTVAAIPAATTGEIAAATTARVSGWGATSEHGDDVPTVLRSAEVPLVDDATCAPLGIDARDELCAGGTGTDSCYGDSGGPLVVQSARGAVLAGVVSWGEECGGPTPGVYAEVPTFADWIRQRVDDPDAPSTPRLPADAGESDEWDDDGFDDGWDDGWDDGFDDADDEWDDDEYDEWDDDEYDEYDDGWVDGFDDDGWDDGFDEWDDEYDEYDDGWVDGFCDHDRRTRAA